MATISINRNTQLKLDAIIRFIYDSVKIDYAYTQNGNLITKYYNRNNKWYEENKIDAEECDGYSDCELDGKESTNEPVYYKFLYTPHFGDDDEKYKFNKREQKILSDNNLENIFIKYNHDLVLENISGFNHDHRGSDHTQIELPFTDRIRLTPVDGKINFLELVQTCFDIKSHKFDFWYELFCGVKKFRLEGGDGIATIVFDHGS